MPFQNRINELNLKWEESESKLEQKISEFNVLKLKNANLEKEIAELKISNEHLKDQFEIVNTKAEEKVLNLNLKILIPDPIVFARIAIENLDAYFSIGKCQ